MPEKIENLSADELCEKGIKANNEGEYKNAIKHLKKATELNLDHKKAFYNLGAVYEKIKEYDAAIENLEEAFENNSKNLNALILKAKCYVLLGKREEGIETYKKVLQIEPNHEDSIFNTGFHYKQLKNYKKAREY